MDPRDSFDPNRDLGNEPSTATTDTTEPPPDGIRTAGTTQIVPGADQHTDDDISSAAPADANAGSSSRAGMPGDGAGRRDEVGGQSGVHLFTDPDAPENAPVRTGAEWGQSDRGPEGYYDAGTSETSPAGTVDDLGEG
ncbi:MAG: hypothetical protein ACJ77B_05075 [Chloroflexota bacterium]